MRSPADVSRFISAIRQLKYINKRNLTIIINIGDTPFCRSLPVIINPKMARIARGSNNKPVCVGVNRNKRCATTGVRKIDENNPMPEINVSIGATLKVLLSNTRRSTTGLSTCNSHNINPTRQTMAMTVRKII